MAIKVGRIMLLFFVSSWRIIHFGMNPVRGGRPPMERRIVNIMAVIMGVLFHVWDSDSVVVVAEAIKSINIVRVIVM